MAIQTKWAQGPAVLGTGHVIRPSYASRRLAVVGGGIGGLAFAILAARRGWEVCLYEAAPEVRAQGSGFVVQPGGQAVLRALGLWENIGARAEPLGRLWGVDVANGATALDVRVPHPARQGHAVERAGLVRLLVEEAVLSGVSITTGRRVERVVEGCLVFADGQSVGPWAGIVDASGGGGMASGMRARMLPYGAYWATVPWVDGVEGIPRRQLTQRYRDTRTMAGVLPLGRTLEGQEVAAFFWSVRMLDAPALQARGIEAWHAGCVEHWPEVAPFIAGLRSWGDLRLACYSHGRLRHPRELGLVRIGDAARRTSPQLGQGANMALLDAWALAVALDIYPDWERATAAAVRARALHTGLYHVLSGMFTPQYQSDRVWMAWMRNRLLGPVGRVFPAAPILGLLTAGLLAPALRGLPKP